MSKKQKQKDQRKKTYGTKEPSCFFNASSASIVERPANMRFWIPLSLFILAVSGALLFFNLGHYYLWHDEADTALFAKGIARTGDTSAVIDHNIYAYHKGACLKNLCGRYQPPAPYYLAAPFVGANGTGTFWPRFPFALCGLLSVALMLYWMIRSRMGVSARIVFILGLLGNVSFFLFCRQCRYFSLTILLTLVVVYLYMNWRDRWLDYVGIASASILLLGTNYLSYAALYAALGCDYIFFTRRRLRLKFRQWLMLLGPQILFGIAILWIYNPLGTEVSPDLSERNVFTDKPVLLWWHFRDLNTDEFCIPIIMLAALPICFWKRNVWLLRGIVAGVCYIIAVVAFTPQHVSLTFLANTRYLVPLIPLFIAVSAGIIAALSWYKWPLALVLAAAVFSSNILNYPFSPKKWHCRPAEFIGELWTPQITSTEVVLKWIRDFIYDGESILVVPNYMRYPLMYHAPGLVYAWQLEYPPQNQFKDLPLIHFSGQVPPDYILAFGPFRTSAEKIIASEKNLGNNYKFILTLGVLGADTTRPEISIRLFKTLTEYNSQIDDVYVYQLIKPTRDK
jgi:hypothetical protein